MKRIKFLILLSAASVFLCMAPSPVRKPVDGSLDPSLKAMGDIMDGDSAFYFVVWEANSLRPYNKYGMSVVSSVAGGDTTLVAANGNGGARYALTGADKEKGATLLFTLKDEKGKVFCSGKAECEGGRLVRMSMDAKAPGRSGRR